MHSHTVSDSTGPDGVGPLRVLHLGFTDGTSGVAEHARRFRELVGRASARGDELLIDNPLETSWPADRILPRMPQRLCRLARGWDVFHAEMSNACARELWLLLLLMRSRPGVPVVLTVHDGPRLCRYPFATLLHGARRRSLPLRLARKCLDETAGRWIERWIGRHVHTAMATTRSGARRLAPRLRGAQIVHLPLPAPPAPRASNRGGTPMTVTHLLFFGHLKPSKGVDVLVRAFGELCAERTLEPQARLLLCGPADPPFARRLRGMALRVGVVDRVDFLGYVPEDDLPCVFDAALAAVLPYRSIRSASASGALLRCLVHGLPVVGSDCGRLREQIQDGVDGLLFREGDVSDLKDKIRRVCHDVQLRGRLRAGGLEKAAGVHNAARIARSALECYHAAAGRSKGEGGAR